VSIIKPEGADGTAATPFSEPHLYRGREIGYVGAHYRARNSLSTSITACTVADKNCSGRLEVALRKDAPEHLIRVDPGGRRFFIGENPLEGYMWLCSRHHYRYDERKMVISKEAKARGGRLGGSALSSSAKQREAAALNAMKARCQHWRIRRGKACTCGQHGDIK
jgi:hypothetical protein